MTNSFGAPPSLILATLAHSGLQSLDTATVRAVVHQAVRDVLTAPPTADPPADPELAALRAVVDGLAAATYALGELMLEVDPAYLSDTAAAAVLAPLCGQIGDNLEHSLAARHYAISGDGRALHGTGLTAWVRQRDQPTACRVLRRLVAAAFFAAAWSARFLRCRASRSW